MTLVLPISDALAPVGMTAAIAAVAASALMILCFIVPPPPRGCVSCMARRRSLVERPAHYIGTGTSELETATNPAGALAIVAGQIALRSELGSGRGRRIEQALLGAGRALKGGGPDGQLLGAHLGGDLGCVGVALRSTAYQLVQLHVQEVQLHPHAQRAGTQAQRVAFFPAPQAE